MEMYPTERAAGAKVTEHCVQIENMPHMATFVYEFYQEKVKAMKEMYQVSFLLICLKFFVIISLCNFCGHWN